jgi:hypothetical protein
MADYRIGPDGTSITFLSDRATLRASGDIHPKIGFKIEHVGRFILETQYAYQPTGK